MEPNEPVILLSTTAPGLAAMIAQTLITERHAACVNIIRCQSVYRWKGELCRDEEDLMVVKTGKHKIPDLMSKVRELHSYELPEMVVIPIVGGYPPYLDWLNREVT